MGGDVCPILIGDLSMFVQIHFSINNITKIMGFIFGANGNKIHPIG